MEEEDLDCLLTDPSFHAWHDEIGNHINSHHVHVHVFNCLNLSDIWKISKQNLEIWFTQSGGWTLTFQINSNKKSNFLHSQW